MARTSEKKAEYYVYWVSPRTKKVTGSSFHKNKVLAEQKAKQMAKKGYRTRVLKNPFR